MRRRAPFAAVVVGLAVTGVVSYIHLRPTHPITHSYADAVTKHERTQAKPAGITHPPMSLAPSTPTTLSIPRLAIRTSVTAVGVGSDGEMEEPTTAEGVSWYKRGYLPGAIGNAVFAGHYTWLSKPGIFHDLTLLVPGDEILVTNEQQHVLRFTVRAKEHYLTESAPGEAIFGKSDAAQIKLITCYGRWSNDTQQYQERYIVTAQFVSETAPRP